MRVLILGMDGYLGWPLSLYLRARGNTVIGCDDYTRRRCVAEVGSRSVTPLPVNEKRLRMLGSKSVEFYNGSVTDADFVDWLVQYAKPDAIVHFAEIPSAPYSMRSQKACTYVQANNVIGTLNVLFAMQKYAPQAQLVKLGTMGEYGTPGIAISEGKVDFVYKGRKARINFPRTAGSWYHYSKIHDTHNIEFACNLWKLRCTDIMQGVVYGVHIPEMGSTQQLLTRFDVDEAFGTAINRFCAQALVGMPITPYGKGKQQRGFLPLCDSMQCINIVLQNPPAAGEHRVINQLEHVYRMDKLAVTVAAASARVGIRAHIKNTPNPRIEEEDHYYKVECRWLQEHGYKTTIAMHKEIERTLGILQPWTKRVIKDAIAPKTFWRKS